MCAERYIHLIIYLLYTQKHSTKHLDSLLATKPTSLQYIVIYLHYTSWDDDQPSQPGAQPDS